MRRARNAGLTLLAPLKPDMMTDFFASSVLAEKVVCLPMDERQVWRLLAPQGFIAVSFCYGPVRKHGAGI